MLLAYDELMEMIREKKLITNLLSLDQVNGSSVDVRLNTKILREHRGPVVDLTTDQNLNFEEAHRYFWDQDDEHFSDEIPLAPGEFILASTIERFNLPRNISACFHMKSSMARRGLSHMMAGHCNPGWTNSTLTLELKNDTAFTGLILRPGMVVGQMVFYKHEEVPEEMSYQNRGKYNNASGVEGAL